MFTCKVTLRVHSKILNLEILTSYFGKTEKGFSMGDKYNLGKKQRPHTLWTLSSKEESSIYFEKCIFQLISFLKNTNYQEITSECEMDILCLLSSDNGQGGLHISTNLLSELNEHNLGLVFDFYSISDD